MLNHQYFVKVALALAAGIIAVAGSAQHAVADDAVRDAGSDDGKQAAAAQAYREGKAAYDAKSYDDAIIKWQQSLALSNASALKFNLAQAYRLRNLPTDCVAASKLYAAFAAATSDAALKSASLGFVDELAPCVASQAAIEPQEKVPIEGRVPAISELPPAYPPKVDAAPISEQPTRAPRFRVASITAAGIGVAAIGVGAFFSMRARTASDDIYETCGKPGANCQWSTALQATEDRGRQAAQLQWVFYGVGGAALITAGTLYYLGHRKGTQHVAVVPTSRNAAMISWSGSW
jgi:hypothetical protein